jgi:hypothetical protein
MASPDRMIIMLTALLYDLYSVLYTYLKAVSFTFISAFLILLSQEVTNPSESRLIKVKLSSTVVDHGPITDFCDRYKIRTRNKLGWEQIHD